jgi:prevent-host-death family protein
MSWHLQDAKNNFSRVVQKAIHEGPQMVTLRGKRTAVILSIEEYEKLTSKAPSLGEFLLGGPAWDDDFVEEVNQRNKSETRDFDL